MGLRLLPVFPISRRGENPVQPIYALPPLAGLLQRDVVTNSDKVDGQYGRAAYICCSIHAYDRLSGRLSDNRGVLRQRYAYELR